MAKKKSRKKRNLKYAAPTEKKAPVPAVDLSPVTVVPAAVAVVQPYVSADLRRIGLLAGGCLAVQLLLWWLIGHTGLGATLDGLIKL